MVTDGWGGFVEIDISTCNLVNSYNVKSAICCAVSPDNKFLITAEDELNGILTKWSVQSKKELHTWVDDTDEIVES